ncbi:MAG: PA0069 family radical SAM protein [Alphaproteobacteria bacterium]|nr:PA0069 family radical SAM protein [Alphaproteobacteria bacterium]
MVDAIPVPRRKARAALSNASGRFETERRVLVDDGWQGEEADALPPLKTTVQADTSRTIIARNDSPDIPFDRSINPYRGCEHGCIYCFARPTHAFLGLSPGQDFESRLFAKPDAARLLAAELRKPGYVCDVMALGTNTDPYQPIERKLRVTRGILETLAAFSHPVGIVTKSALVTRDIDILAPMARRRLARVFLSVTTLDPVLARAMEPRAAPPKTRLDAIRALAQAGVPVGVMTAPMIPGLNDSELEAILEAARAAGASSAGYVALRLPHEIKDLFREWLETNYPNRAARVLALVRDMRGGKLNDARFGARMKGEGAFAQLIQRRFALAAGRLGYDRERFALDTSQFAPPTQAGDQMRLL